MEKQQSKDKCSSSSKTTSRRTKHIAPNTTSISRTASTSSTSASSSSNFTHLSSTPAVELRLASPNVKSVDTVNSKAVCQQSAGSIFYDNRTEDLQSAVSLVKAGANNTTPPPNLVVSSPETPRECIDFPIERGDILHAFLSKEALLKMCRVRRPNDDTNVLDELSHEGADESADGSLGNSLHSWTSPGSLNSSLASKYAAMELQEEIAALQQQTRLRQKRWNRQIRAIRRVAVLLWMASVLRYRFDTTNGYSAASTRETIVQEPLGLLGFGQFALAFVCCLKFQRFFERPISISQSRCPALQCMSQMYESRMAAAAAQDDSSRTSPPLIRNHFS